MVQCAWLDLQARMCICVGISQCGTGFRLGDETRNERRWMLVVGWVTNVWRGYMWAMSYLTRMQPCGPFWTYPCAPIFRVPTSNLHLPPILPTVLSYGCIEKGPRRWFRTVLFKAEYGFKPMWHLSTHWAHYIRKHQKPINNHRKTVTLLHTPGDCRLLPFLLNDLQE